METYIVAIKPHEEMCIRIEKERAIFAEKIRQEKVIWGDFISLLIFKQINQFEKQIIVALKRSAGELPLLKFDIENYLLMPSHSLCLNLVGRKSVKAITDSIKKLPYLFRNETENKPFFIFEPKIIIANRLKPWQYEQAALAYNHETFRGMFVADKLYLLKRDVNGKTIQLASFPFNTMCKERKQLVLF